MSSPMPAEHHRDPRLEQQDDGHAERHPREERQRDAGLPAHEADADQVRRRADGRAEAADRGRERRREQERRRIRREPGTPDMLLEHAQQREPDREHHRDGGRVADPHRDGARGAGVGGEDASGVLADARQPEDGEREAAIEAVEEDRLRQHERADEEEDERIRERRERLGRRRHAEHDRDRDAEERGHRHGDRFAHPEDDDCGQHRGEAVRGLLERERGRPDGGERERRAEEAQELAGAPGLVAHAPGSVGSARTGRPGSAPPTGAPSRTTNVPATST
jgi:hypothetical protein